jgi:hypothetical protein
MIVISFNSSLKLMIRRVQLVELETWTRTINNQQLVQVKIFSEEINKLKL